MKKSILNLGTILSKNAQKKVSGGLTKLTKYDPNCHDGNETTCVGYKLSSMGTLEPYQYTCPCN